MVGLNPSENMKVNWDDDIPNINGKTKLMFQNHQPDMYILKLEARMLFSNDV